MKTQITIFIFCVLVCSFVDCKKKSKNKHTPQAIDLKNHFGAPSVEEIYGPERNNLVEYVEKNPDTFVNNFKKGNGRDKILNKLKYIPYPGADKKLNPHVIKSGEMTNIAPSAEKIITPEIAVPKLHVEAEMEHQAVVGLPTFVGMKTEFHPVTAYDKETGQIVHDKVIINRPEYKVEKHVINIGHKVTEQINLKNGERIQVDTKKVLHAEPDTQSNSDVPSATPLNKN
jgi:hypothetical protein